MAAHHLYVTDEVRFLAPDNFKTKNMTSRKIKLKRKEIIRFGVPEEFKQDKICILGSYNDRNGNVARPLTYAEEDKWMGELVGLKPTDVGFRQAVGNWYKNVRIKVTPIGVEFEIGQDEGGNPLNLEEWILYKFSKGHPWMAKNEQECKGAEHLQFWFEDLEADSINKSQKLELTTKAHVELAQLTEDVEKMDWVIRTVIGKYPKLGSLSELIKLTPDKKKLKIGEVILEDPAYFIEVMSDKDLMYKAEIASMVESGVLTKEGNKYLNGTENLGSLEGTIAWMKDANNGVEYAILKARLEEFGTPIATKPKVKKEK
jgi:hypothetical protein